MPILLALTSAVIYGISDYCGGRAARSISLLTVLVITQTATVAGAAVLVAASGDAAPSARDVAWSAGSGLASVSAVGAFYFALARGAMTVVAPITAVVSAVLPLAVGIAGGERPSAVALTGVLVALVAVSLVSGAMGRADRPTRPLIAALAVLAGVGFGLLFVFLDRTSDASGRWPLLIGHLTAWPLVALAATARRVRLRAAGPAGVAAFAAGALAVVANLSYLTATRGGLLSLVAVITSMYPATTVGLATLLDRERLSTSQLAGLVLAAAALVMVATGA